MAANGRLPASDLRPIAGGQLAHGAAAAWNTMRLFIWQTFHIDIRPAGPRSSYREYRWQLYFWNLYKAGRGNVAAYPGSSNHGWGNAVDVMTTAMANAISKCMRYFGWSHAEGARVGEWWHYTYVGGFKRPNPGTSLTYPIIRHGSGGPGQKHSVKKIQKHLRRHLRTRKIRVDGAFGTNTTRSVKRFQQHHKMKADGIVGEKTWRALRGKRR